MKRILLYAGICLFLCASVGAETVILDSSDTLDWARVMSYNYPKYKDTMIRPTALLKFVTGTLPANATITSATLYFKRFRTMSGATITVSYASDDSWSFDLTDVPDLYNWPEKATIGTYQTGG